LKTRGTLWIGEGAARAEFYRLRIVCSPIDAAYADHILLKPSAQNVPKTKVEAAKRVEITGGGKKFSGAENIDQVLATE
jgi:hypothetical protein